MRVLMFSLCLMVACGGSTATDSSSSTELAASTSKAKGKGKKGGKAKGKGKKGGKAKGRKGKGKGKSGGKTKSGGSTAASNSCCRTEGACGDEFDTTVGKSGCKGTWLTAESKCAPVCCHITGEGDYELYRRMGTGQCHSACNFGLKVVPSAKCD